MDVPDPTPRPRVAVALIDSDMEVRRGIQLRLRAALFEVRAYASGRAMLVDDELRADCVVTRDEMEELGGFELLRCLRDRGWQGPAILLSSTPRLNLAATAARAGFHSVVDRPLVDDFMLHAVEAATRRVPKIAP